MEFTQPLGVGLGLAVRMLELTTNTVTQYVWEDAQTIIRQSTIRRKYHGSTSYLLGNIDAGTQEFAGMETVWTIDRRDRQTSHR